MARPLSPLSRLKSRAERERQSCNRRCVICGNPVAHDRRKTCSRSCATTLQVRNTPARFYNDFLPADAEENLHGIWVPSPAEIEFEKRKIRKLNEETMEAQR